MWLTVAEKSSWSSRSGRGAAVYQASTCTPSFHGTPVPSLPCGHNQSKGSNCMLGKSSSLDSRFNPWVRQNPWRRTWESTPVFSPGEFHRQRSLTGYSPWGCKESDTIERLSFIHWIQRSQLAWLRTQLGAKCMQTPLQSKRLKTCRERIPWQSNG